MLREFIQVVKNECVLNHDYFSFFDIPDLIVKRKYQRKDYDLIIKLLGKVKKNYLAHKALIVTETPVDKLQITDEDLVPLEIFDDVMNYKEHKFDDKRSQLGKLISNAKNEAAQKIKSLGVDAEKTKKIVENSVFVSYLNTLMENAHQQIFTFNYKH